MKKIIIKESELKQLIEMEVMQYSDNDNFLKHFYTTLEDSELLIDDWSIPSDSDVGGKLNIDWTVGIVFSEKGFIYKIHINSVEGSIWAQTDWRNKDSRKDYKVSSKNGWKIIYDDLSVLDGKVEIQSIWVLPDKRIFKIQ